MWRGVSSSAQLTSPVVKFSLANQLANLPFFRKELTFCCASTPPSCTLSPRPQNTLFSQHPLLTNPTQ